MTRPSHRGTVPLAGAAVVLIALSTLWPLPGSPPTTERWCLACGDLGGVDVLNNLVLFFPFGVALAWRWPVGRVVMAGLALSLVVEVLQWRVVPGRDASLGDLVANTGGALCGALGAHLWPRVSRPSRPLALVGTILTLATLAGIIGGAAWAYQPAPIKWNHYLGIAPARDGRTPWGGRVSDVFLADVPLAPYDVVSPLRHGDRYMQGEIDLRATILGTAGPQRGVILRIANPIEVPAEVIQRDGDLVFRARRNASRLKLRSPSVTQPAAFSAPDTGGAYAFQSRAYELSIAGPGQRTELRLSAARAWAMAGPFEVRSPTVAAVLDAAFLLLLSLCIAYFAAAHGPRTLAVAAVAVLGLVGLSASLMPPLPLHALVGLALGLLLGRAAGRRAAT